MISPSRGEVSYEAQIIHEGPSRVSHLCLRLGLCVYPAAIGSRHLGLEIRRSCSSSFASRPSSDRGIAFGGRRAQQLRLTRYPLSSQGDA